MEAPPVQYTTTPDSISIAWTESGDGPPLLYCQPTPFSHVEQYPPIAEAHFKVLRDSFRLIMFDARGTGMSERDVEDVSADTLLADAEAVVRAANLERFAVNADAGLLATTTAVRIALALPEQVSHLVFEAPYQNQRELADTPYGRASKALAALAEVDWNMYVQARFRVASGLDPGNSTWLEPMAKMAATWADRAVGLRYERMASSIDLGPILAGVRQPTLVLRPDPSPIPTRCCQRFAARIPGALFREHTDPAFQRQAELLRDFLLPSSPSSMDALVSAPGGLRTVLFTDLVGHTEMMQRLGDDKGREVLREHERITRETLKEHAGAEVKTMGDGFMASFGSVTKAMDCAIALQRAFAAHTESMPEPLDVRVGLNAGEPIEEDGDLFGSTVILAARIAAQAGAGEILIPEPLRHLLSGKSYVYADRGEVALKGFEDAVRLYEVRWRE